ncbi:MAG: glycosyltransferase [Candidatus Parcubacteria bacterium]|nr:glycosyltransferase [Candidatus Parcubacteria bacterium]
MKPILSIIYVYFNTPNELRGSIKSLKHALGDIPSEIIIIDNASAKALPNDLDKSLSIKVIKNTKNYGYGRGLNQGASIAEGKYLLLVNPDIEFKPNSIEYLLEEIEREQKVGVIGPQLVGKKGETLQSISGAPFLPKALVIFSFIGKIWRNNPILNKYHNIMLDRNKKQYVDVIGGACMMMRKSLFNDIGGFDESFFMYFEEADFCLRLKKKGYRVLYYPKAQVIHLVGRSSQDKEWIEKIFEQSRFRFFRKYHGLIPAFFGELALRFFKPTNVLLFIILSISAFLNFYKISERMIFIGDQGWFYLSARDMLLTGNIPLVGITASHTWLHQGPLWTYILAIIFKVSNFHPLAPGYFTAFLGTITVLSIYKLAKEMFSKRVGVISALLYSVSPAVVLNSQMPYHTSPIPLLTIILISLVYRWTRGSSRSFPLIFFFLGLLYNFELATQVFWITIIVVFIVGFMKKKAWALSVLNKKTLFLSALFFILPMLPVIAYDFNHHFSQTLKFFAWIPYRASDQIVNFVNINSDHGNSVRQMFNFFSTSYQNLVFAFSYKIALLIMFSAIVYFLYYCIRSWNKRELFFSINILALFIGIPLAGFYINMTPSNAYIPLLFPSFIIFTAWFFERILRMRYLLFPVIILIFLITIFNVLFMLDPIKGKPAYGLYYIERLNAANKILKETNGQYYEIKGRGAGSQFESFTMNYEYLVWWLGYPSSKKDEKLKIYISESVSGIKIEKNK